MKIIKNEIKSKVQKKWKYKMIIHKKSQFKFQSDHKTNTATRPFQTYQFINTENQELVREGKKTHKQHNR